VIAGKILDDRAAHHTAIGELDDIGGKALSDDGRSDPEDDGHRHSEHERGAHGVSMARPA